MEDKEAEENTGTKDGKTRDDDIPDKKPSRNRWRARLIKATCTQVSRTSRKGRTLGVMAGKPWETEWAPTTAANDCCTIAEIGVWMAWITEAKNSGEMEALAEVPDACMDVRTAIDVTKTVDAGAEETGALQTISRMSRRHDGWRDSKREKETQSDTTRALLNRQQTNKSAKRCYYFGNPEGKATSKGRANHKCESAPQWHNYACPQWTSVGQHQISQLTLIIDNLINIWLATH